MKYVQELIDAVEDEVHVFIETDSIFQVSKAGIKGRFKIGSPMLPKIVDRR